MRNRERNKVRKLEGGRGKARSSILDPRPSLLAGYPLGGPPRRGVLLLVVLSMLVLFMLIGTAFLMTSNQSRIASKHSAKKDRLDNLATRKLDRAMMQLVRDTDNPYSVIRYHSLLRDLYGTDGLQGQIYQADLTKGENAWLTRFAGGIAGNSFDQLGPTYGQFVDIYVSAKGYTLIDASNNAIDYTTSYDGGKYPLDLRNVLKLDRNPYGQPQPYPMPPTKGYFNGCLLTITSGPATGQSTRILDYEYITDLGTTPAKTSPTRLFHFRVMAFPRKDGKQLVVDQTAGAKGRMPEIADLAGATFMVNGRAFSGTGVGYNPLAATGQPRLSALQLLPLDNLGGFKSFPIGAAGNYIGAEIALLPNSVYFNPLSTTIAVGAIPATISDPFQTLASTPLLPLNNLTATTPVFNYPTFVGTGGANEGYDAADFQNVHLAMQTVTPRSQGRVVHAGSSAGTGTPGPPEWLDLSDPRVLTDTINFLRLDIEDVPIPSFHRPDLLNFWNHRLLKYLTTKPSNPLKLDDAVRAIVQPYSSDPTLPLWTVNGGAIGLTPADAALISAIKRQISFRPTREDHPHFDGTNPASIPADLSSIRTLVIPGDATPKPNVNYTIAVPIWDVVGPWDVDNDNDGVRDSNWVDLGDPIQETEDGRRFRTLYAFHCVDLDNRLNVNAHGMADDLVPPLDGSGNSLDTTRTPYFDMTYTTSLSSAPGNMAHESATSVVRSTLQLPRGLGYGPADISLRPVFPAPLDIRPSYVPIYGNRSEIADPRIDSYATVLSGRLSLDRKAINGRNGFDTNINITAKSQAATAGTNYHYDVIDQKKEPNWSPRWDTGELATPNLAAQMKFFDYPWATTQPSVYTKPLAYPKVYPTPISPKSAFGTSPDLKGRYALGIDYAGQPVYEVANDVNPNTAGMTPDNWLHFNLLANSPYELDLSNSQRRDNWAVSSSDPTKYSDPTKVFTSTIDRSYSRVYDTSSQIGLNDDAPFSPTDLEKILRGWDADSGTLPSRLWDVATEFDPQKLLLNDPNRVRQAAEAAFGVTPSTDPVQKAAAELAAAQQIAGISRRLVTTEGYDLPVANLTMPSYVSDFGPDGAPGRRNGAATERTLNDPRFDDFQAITGVNRSQAKIIDLLGYRVWLEARRYEMQRQGLTEPDLDKMASNVYTAFMTAIRTRVQAVSLQNPRIMSDLFAPEVIAGKRMDLNRPFGDGKDNNSDDVVDDPLEAGEPFLDVNGNGKRDDGTSGTPVEPFIDINGDGKYERPGDKMWTDLTNSGTLGEQIEFDYTNGHEELLHVRVSDAVKKALNLPPAMVLGGVRNLDSQGRQLFARHLYCLMLLLIDENYIAPWDEKDPQINKFLDLTIDNSLAKRLRTTIRVALGPDPDPNPNTNHFDQRADELARVNLLRKLTCRSIAQWAINCVDMRDADAIMTPFEYDENPWDGWGVWDDNWAAVPDLANPPFKNSTFIPLDGDVATDENSAWVIDWSIANTTTGACAKVRTQMGVDPTKPVKTDTAPLNPPLVTNPLNQTRGVVWGVERPELLITETLAWHDRRTEDRKGDSQGKHDEFHTGTTTDSQYYLDIDMDQRLRPKGALFVELYNPWSPNGQLPAELYTRCDGTTGYQPKYSQDANKNDIKGVDLSRLSKWGLREVFEGPPTSEAPNPIKAVLTPDISDGIVKRTPVWRLIVVDDWPRARNRDRAKIGNGASQTGGSVTANQAPQFKNYSQRVGDVPPDVTLQMPAGVTASAAGPPAYLMPLVTDVEAWDATKPPPYRAPNPDFDEMFNGGFTPTQVPQANNDDFPNKFSIEYPYIEREFYFTTDNSPTVPVRQGLGWGEYNTVSTQALDWDYSQKNFKLRIPDRYIKLSGVSYGPSDPTDGRLKWARSQKFIPIGLEKQKVYQDLDLSVPRPVPQSVLAPILPGRYGVVGTAGTRYFKDSANPNLYTTTVGRPDLGNTKYTDDSDLLRGMIGARRIEMQFFKPAPKLLLDPDLQQLVVASNGGDPKDQVQTGDTQDPFATEIGRDNELIRNDNFASTDPRSIDNVTLPVPDTDPDPKKRGKAKYYQACVAIPVEGMSASEPPWGWGPREAQAAGQELDIALKEKDKHDAANPANKWPDPVKPDYAFDPKAANGEGCYTIPSGDIAYDKPFDVAPELMRTGTTANYRTTHLQRLANPQLPWNPLPGQYKDVNGTDFYRPNLPVNPYRTIDSSSVNLTAFNGTSSEEHNMGPTSGQAEDEGKLRPWERASGELDKYVTALNGPTVRDPDNTTDSALQVFSFKSVERGFWSRLNGAGWIGSPPANQGVAPPERVLWAQEPALVELRMPRLAGVVGRLLDLISGRQMTMRFDEVPHGQSDPPPANSDSFPPVNGPNGPADDDLYASQSIAKNHCDMVLKHSLGFGNESFGLLYDRLGAKRANLPRTSPTTSAAPLVGTGPTAVPIASAIGAPASSRFIFPYDVDSGPPPASGKLWHDVDPAKAEAVTINSTYPWLAWDNRPYISTEDLLKVPAVPQSQMLHGFSTIDPNVATASRLNPYGLGSLGLKPVLPVPPPLPAAFYPAVANANRWPVMQAPFGQLANVFAASSAPADMVRDTDWLPKSGTDASPFVFPSGYVPFGIPVRFDKDGVPLIPDDPTKEGNLRPYGAPNFGRRILEYVQVPSRFIGTDTMLNAEIFNDVPTYVSNVEPFGSDITGSADPRYNFQPPFNKVSRERDPGRVNLNTVTGRRIPPPAATATAQIWSEVYDGIMHRLHDANPTANQLSHYGPAWRDVVLSRRGYAQVDAVGNSVDKPPPGINPNHFPDTLEMGLNNNFPTLFANPFRSPDAGDLVPLTQMMQYGVDASFERVHPRNRGMFTAGGNSYYDPQWGSTPWPAGYSAFNDARDAGLGNDGISYRTSNFAIPETAVTNDPNVVSQRDTIPLFSEARDQPFADTNRNSYMMYEPMSRLSNLVTNRSGAYAVWITVGYFEVEPAPAIDATRTNDWGNKPVYEHFGGDINLYNRVYPDGYMLGKELGSETGDVKRPRGFYIIDRTEEVGFKPGEDLNVEKTVRLRRRIE